MREESSLWFNQAGEDFKSIDSLLRDKRYHGAVLFAQQAIEKILKAYIIERNQTLPLKTHRIDTSCQKNLYMDKTKIDKQLKTF
ncbi:hypothetical protein CO051_03695 [Candidatus Roizmanbacteria bacterium CG_4_9_14_0_2_um_filter_39_13]|uniref:HEPN domain-containing protein n=1 Tax=Candidatus Roizmanbacteria bacterium CG_4_9_14_0_2_um_filter_39_13 TaxID=1974839 RepID=A0A2M8EYW3_9BACT|nr:MAG: hypothetical protein CO051_03695 [Candidatus Roizmanbacteria bacterium CG_4_9_14_0_2_um_filter_39_13]